MQGTNGQPGTSPLMSPGPWPVGTKTALPELSGQGGSEASLCARLLPIALMTA